MEKIIKQKIVTNVQEALSKGWSDMLPEQVAENYLTKWVLSFDFLNKKNYERNSNTIKNEYDSIISGIVKTALTPNIEFYFASLFHIGRTWKVAEQALDTTTKALDSNNLQITINQQIKILQELPNKPNIPTELYSSALISLLTEILKKARQNHEQAIIKSKQWWGLWLKETQELKGITESISQQYNRRTYNQKHLHYVLSINQSLLMYSFSNKQLFNSLQTSGVQIKNISSAIQPSNLSQLLGLLTYALVYTGLDNPFRLHEAWHEMDRIFRHLNQLSENELKSLEKRRLLPIIEQVESKLLSIFKNKNLFEDYKMLRLPPDTNLKSLWNKCKLPDGNMFYYANNWLNSLGPEPKAHEDLPFKLLFTQGDIINYARSADSTIKRYWVSTEIKTGWTVKEHTQFLYEKKWVVDMANSATYRIRNNRKDQQWTLDKFEEMLIKVTSFLDEKGYELVTPNKNRLSKLWSKVTTTDFWGSEEW